MEFSLLHAGLAAGAALAAIPVILHLILREKPRRERFPALRLIRLRHRINLRKLRLRHWLLLALRMLLIALMALALARPSVHGTSFIPDQQAPVAAALVFDTSLSMEYRERDRTRLQEAQESALGLLKEFTDGSEVLVLDSADPVAHFFPDVGLARQRVESLRLRPRARSLHQAIIEACRSLSTSDRTRKEIYVFTDLAVGSFSLDGATELQNAIKSTKGGVAVFVLNVGVTQPRNAFIDVVTPSAEVIPANSDLVVSCIVQDTGRGEPVTLECELDNQIRGSSPLQLESDRAKRVDFLLPRLATGIHQGQLRLANGGGLAFDDVHYLTIEVRPVTRVLVVSDAERDAVSLRTALAPPLLVEQQRAWYQCDWTSSSRLSSKRLGDYSVVTLVNVGSLPGASWRELEAFVRSGGGLGVFLGDRVQADSYNQEAAQTLIPAKLGTLAVPAEEVRFRARDVRHAMVRKLHEWDEAALGKIIIERYIRCEPAEEHAQRTIDFSDGAPAFVERTLGGAHPGRVVVCTTAVSPGRPGEPWNDLPQSYAQFVMLADGLAGYLAGHGEQQLNYQVGDNVVLNPARDQRVDVYLLRTPDPPQPTRRSAAATQGTILVTGPEALGNYRVTAGQGAESFEKGFSLNPDPMESRLNQLSASELSAVLGPGNFAVARSAEELREVMGDVRIGRELFPWLMLLLVLLFALEHLLANRFYKKVEPGPVSAKPARGREPLAGVGAEAKMGT
ncbi:MAG: BatA domain-containing protein [Planctomycetes bacterium]|nr:BatA domain-containing protein [Planctomycetota bacterium]